MSNVLKRKEVIEKQKRNKPSSFSTYQTQIEQLFNKGISKLRIWQILTDEYAVTRSYSAFTKYARVHLKKATPAYIVQNTPPGDEAEVDFGFSCLVPTTEGKQIKVWIFVMTLSYSRHAFYSAVTDQSLETFIQCHQQAFEYFGGVPKSVKIDNLKAAILKNQRYDLEINKLFLDFSFHFKFVIKPCTPYEPQQKGKVESRVGYVKKNFLAGRTFTDLTDLRMQLKQWMVETANKRIHGTTKQVPVTLFQTTEKSYLQSLPETSFTLESPLVRLVKLNCHINFQNNYYSVPARFTGELVDVRTKGNFLVISANNEEITQHVITQGEGHYVTNPTHFPPDRVYSATSYQAKYEKKMKAIGSSAHEFFKQLIIKDHLWLRVVKKILGLAQIYGSAKVDKALKRALIFKAFKPSTIERILKDNLQDLEIEPILLGKATKQAFGADQKVISRWKRQLYDSGGALSSLVPHSTKPKRIRTPRTHLKIIEFIKGERDAHPRIGKDKLKPDLDIYCAEIGIPNCLCLHDRQHHQAAPFLFSESWQSVSQSGFQMGEK